MFEPLPVVTYNGARDRVPQAARWDAADMIARLVWPRMWKGAKRDLPAWSPVVMRPGATRGIAGVVSVSALVLDCDAGDPLDRLEALGADFVRYGHTSWSHTPEHPKARLVFPFATPCPVDKWPRVWGAAARWAAAHGVTVDQSAKDPSRLYFLPYVPYDPTAEPGGNVQLEQFESWRHVDGLPRLSWARLAMDYPEPRRIPVYTRASTGKMEPTADEKEQARRRYAAGAIRHRCRQIEAHGEGGRNVRVYAAARLAARLAAGGWVAVGEAAAQIEAAGLASGLGPKETARAVRNGLTHGAEEGPWDIDAHITHGEVV